MRRRHRWFPRLWPANIPSVVPELLAPVPITTQKRATDAASAVTIDARSEVHRDLLCAVTDFGLSAKSYYAATDQLNPPYHRAIPGAREPLYVRKTVGTKLQQVDAFLQPFGLQLHILDAYRSLECQQALWNYFWDLAGRMLPKPTDEQRRTFAVRYCSDPRPFDPARTETWPPHLTGGAVDLTLKRRSTGELLFMGGIFDDASEVSHTDYFEVRSSSAAGSGSAQPLNSSDREALRNRRILYHAMARFGFSNYAFEWWHFDWGNPFWAMDEGAKDHGKAAPAAFYGPIREYPAADR